MNFTHIFFLQQRYGFVGCLIVMLTLCTYVYWRFKKAGWL